ncbi:MAG: c-type cytochrome [Myxococcota bacterium]
MRSVGPVLSCLLISALACGDGMEAHHSPRSTLVGAAEPAGRGAPVSGPLALTPDDKLLLVASPDHQQLIVVDRAQRAVVRHIPLGVVPSHVVVDENGLALISAEHAHEVHVVDPVSGAHLRSMKVGVSPVGLALKEPGVVAVALAGESAVALLDVNTGRVVAKTRLTTPEPRALAFLPDGKLVVSHLTRPVLSVVDYGSSSVRSVDLHGDRSVLGSMKPTLVTSMTLDERGTVILPHSQANVVGILAPPPDPGCRYYSGCEGRSGAVVPSVTEVAVDLPLAETGAACSSCTPDAVTVRLLDPNGALPTPLHNPVASALVGDGRAIAVLGLGTQNVVIVAREGTGVRVLGTAEVGEGPVGMTVTRDGKQLYVFNQFNASISEVDLGSFRVDGTWHSFIPRTFRIAEDVLPPDVAEGRRLFHTALDPRVAANAGASCAACHPGGQADGQTWMTTDGPRNTPSLGGGLLKTAPFHWRGDVETVEDLNNSTIRPLMGGTGMEARSAVQMAAYLDRLPQTPSTQALYPRAPDDVERGRRIFEDPVVGCATCHRGEMLTDNLNHDVGTAHSEDDAAGLQTPSLLGLSRSAPYLHDGSIKTLEQLVDLVVARDRMGQGSQLTRGERADLVAYLESL